MIKTQTQITAEITANITDALNHQNTAAKVRQILYDINDSMFASISSNPYPFNIVKADINISTNDVTLRDLIFVSNSSNSLYAIKSITMPLLQVITDILDIEFCFGLITLDLSALTAMNGASIADNPLLSTLNLPAVTIMENSVIATNIALVTLNLPALTSMDNGATITNNSALVTLSLPVLASMDNNATINNNSALVTLNLSALTSMNNNANIGWNQALTAIIISSLLTGNSINFTSNALNQLGVGGVDDILNKLDVGGSLNGTVNLDSGTNATPSAAGLVSKANLVGKGWTVINN